MTTTTFDDYPRPAQSQPHPRERWLHRLSDESVAKFAAIIFCMYCFRDAATGVVRYYLSMMHLSPLWFVPDIAAVIVFYFFMQRVVARNRSAFGWILFVNVLTAIVIAAFFMQTSLFAFVSSIKLFIPIYVGFMMCGRSIADFRFARYFIAAMMVASIAGLLLNPHVDYPWVGAAIDNFGTTKGVGKIWWQGTERRYGGFAGDSTMAGYMCIFTYFQIQHRLSRPMNFLLWIPIFLAIETSTSKTAIMTFAIFCIYYIAIQFVKEEKRLSVTRRFAQYSFICVAVPFLLILIFGGVQLTEYNPLLYSMQDRINNSWQLPFEYLAQLFPAGLITGCGLGCFSYPMEYTIRRDISVPVDNFYMTTYLMMGLPFIITMFGFFTATVKSQDKNKLINMFLINIYTMTVQCYGPSYATLSIGYTFSDMFMNMSRGRHRRRNAASPAMNEDASSPPRRSWRRRTIS